MCSRAEQTPLFPFSLPNACVAPLRYDGAKINNVDVLYAAAHGHRCKPWIYCREVLQIFSSSMWSVTYHNETCIWAPIYIANGDTSCFIISWSCLRCERTCTWPCCKSSGWVEVITAPSKILSLCEDLARKALAIRFYLTLFASISWGLCLVCACLRC